MKTVIILISSIFLASCSVYDSIKENANSAYEWTKEKANTAVDKVDEAISE